MTILESGGCSLCYAAEYDQPTTSEDILSCAGPVLFVGTQQAYKSSNYWSIGFYLGAFAVVEEVQKTTVLNTPHESNGVYWYFTPGKSFGFLKDDTLQQAAADIGTTNPESRLSWNLGKYGGYRAGANIELSDSIGLWRKVIYNCPFYI